jgi:hypothetical protein
VLIVDRFLPACAAPMVFDSWYLVVSISGRLPAFATDQDLKGVRHRDVLSPAETGIAGSFRRRKPVILAKSFGWFSEGPLRLLSVEPGDFVDVGSGLISRRWRQVQNKSGQKCLGLRDHFRLEGRILDFPHRFQTTDNRPQSTQLVFVE